MKNKTYLFLAINGFQVQVLVPVVLILGIRTIEKMKDCLTNTCAGFGIRKKFIPDPDPRGSKAPDPDPQHSFIQYGALKVPVRCVLKN
jgi:hypothetical protein